MRTPSPPTSSPSVSFHGFIPHLYPGNTIQPLPPPFAPSPASFYFHRGTPISSPGIKKRGEWNAIEVWGGAYPEAFLNVKYASAVCFEVQYNILCNTIHFSFSRSTVLLVYFLFSSEVCLFCRVSFAAHATRDRLPRWRIFRALGPPFLSLPPPRR